MSDSDFIKDQKIFEGMKVFSFRRGEGNILKIHNMGIEECGVPKEEVDPLVLSESGRIIQIHVSFAYGITSNFTEEGYSKGGCKGDWPDLWPSKEACLRQRFGVENA